MSVPATYASMGLGYMGNQLSTEIERPIKNSSKIVVNNVPDMYNNNRSYTIKKNEQQLSNQQWDMATRTFDPKIIVSGLGSTGLGKKDNLNPQTCNYLNRPSTTRESNNRHTNNNLQEFSNNEAFTGNDNQFGGTPPSFNTGQQIQSLSGELISANNFTHNNMVPFFGSNVRQNTNPSRNAPILELYTGTSSYDQTKEEISPMFNPQKDLSFTNGTPIRDDNVRDRFIPSSKRQSEKPIESINVGPGLNKGYTAKPSGGFQQSDVRKFVIPKTVDELRTKTNPKLTYKQPIIPGKSQVLRRGIDGDVSKNRPDRFFVNSPARYNTTVGAVKGKKQRSKPIDKQTNRQMLSRSYGGGAGPANMTKPKVHSNRTYQEPHKEQLGELGVRNATAKDKWEKNEETGDYGKKGIEILPNERDTTQLASYLSNAVGIVKALIAPVEDVFRTTRKENVIGNPRQAGNMQSNVKKAPAYDPNNVTKTTIKETNIHNNHEGFMNSNIHKHTVYDPNDIARTTIKETNVHDSRSGNIKGPTKLGCYDPNDITRTTIKETNIHDNRQGNIQSQYYKGVVYDPNDITRTTIKETNIHDNRQGNIQSQYYKGTVHDPNDITRTTIKETNIHDNRQGNIELGQHKGMVYDPNDITRTTIKETNIHNNRQGNIESQYYKGTVYDPNDITRTTIKETNIHDNRQGNIEKGQFKGIVYDPNDIARTTTKETNIHDVRTGNMTTQPSGLGEGSHAQGTVPISDNAKTTHRETLDSEDPIRNMSSDINKGIVYDPNDIAKTTIKETNIHDNRQGNITGMDNAGKGYLTNPKEAPVTSRQFVSTKSYTGTTDGPEHGGYKVANTEAPDTQKQFISDNEYSGNAESQSKKPKSYDDIYNATLNEIKQEIAKGRTPTQSSVKLGSGSGDINMEIKEKHIHNERDLAITKVVSLPTNVNTGQVTKDKMVIKTEREEIDESLLDAFNNNPYTQSLNSSA